MALKMLSAVIYGDLIMLLKNQVEPYEKNEGECKRLVQKWIDGISEMFRKGRGYSFGEMKKLLPEITKSFSEVPVKNIVKTKVGVVGEIYNVILFAEIISYLFFVKLLFCSNCPADCLWKTYLSQETVTLFPII